MLKKLKKTCNLLLFCFNITPKEKAISYHLSSGAWFEMRILVLGTTGVDKRSYIESVASLFLNSKGHTTKDSHAGEHIKIECIEDELRKMRDDKG